MTLAGALRSAISPFAKTWESRGAVFADKRVEQLVNAAWFGHSLELKGPTREALQAALALAEGRAEQLSLARLASELKQPQVAEEAFKTALQDTSRVEALQVGRLAARTGNAGAAAAAFQRALERSNTTLQALRLAAISHRTAERTGDAGVRAAMVEATERGLEGASQVASRYQHWQRVAFSASEWGYTNAAGRALSRAIAFIAKGGQ